MKLDQEARVTLKKLAELGHSRRELARTLGVAESTIRYHLQRMEQGAVDGRSLQKQLAEDRSSAIGHYLESRRGRRPDQSCPAARPSRG